MGIVKSKEQKRSERVIWVVASITVVAILALLYLWARNSIGVGGGPYHFGAHKQEFQMIVEEIDRFIEKTPDFFETFDGDCSVRKEGLLFYKSDLPYPECVVLHPVTTEGWETAGDYREVFPDEFADVHPLLNKRYPEYVFFISDEKTARFLVYTRGDGRPRELIDDYEENYKEVYVKRVAKDWYDIHPRGDKRYLNE